MMKLFVLGLISASLVAVLATVPTNAQGLKIAPLEYKTTLAANEQQTGAIDISNPTGQSIHVRVNVQAFKQIDNNGGLQFYDDERIARGIRLERTELDLGAREAFRLSFRIDGTALPTGDVYAAIFFTTDPSMPRNGVGQLVRVGTILSIVNKTPGPRSALVTNVNIPFLQFSDTIQGTYTVKNTGPSDTGFYPTVDLAAWPGVKSHTADSSLVFGGRERENDFQFVTGFGIHYVTVSYDGSRKGQWVVTLAPWMLLAIIVIMLIVGIELLLLKRRRGSGHKITDATP